jgi:SAM-dependent methyltransferase
MRAPCTSELLGEAECLESRATDWRVNYYSTRLPHDAKRLLDLACGNGYAVVTWRSSGIQAFGGDIFRYRLSHGAAEHRERRPFVLADARNLPFRSDTFEIVVSSGIIEQVGVRESSNPYTICVEADQDESRSQVIGESSRIVRAGGFFYLDFPDSSFRLLARRSGRATLALHSRCSIARVQGLGPVGDKRGDDRRARSPNGAPRLSSGGPPLAAGQSCS